MNTLSQQLIRPFSRTVHRNVHSRSSCFKRQVSSRVGFGVLVPYSFIIRTVDGILGAGAATIGVGAALISLPTSHRFRDLYQFSSKSLNSFQHLGSSTYFNAIHVLNPRAEMFDPHAWVIGGSGLLTAVAYKILESDTAKPAQKADNFFIKHVVSRASYALLAVSCVITRVVDVIIGTIAAIFSFFALGMSSKLNTWAYRGLQITGIVQDLFFCATKFINPNLPVISPSRE